MKYLLIAMLSVVLSGCDQPEMRVTNTGTSTKYEHLTSEQAIQLIVDKINEHTHELDNLAVRVKQLEQEKK